MKQGQNFFANTLHVYIFLADTKQHIPIKLMASADNPKTFTGRGTLQKKINITEHLIWNLFDNSRSSRLLKLGNIEETLQSFGDCSTDGKKQS